MPIKKFLKALGWLVFLSLPVVVFWQRQTLFDMWRLRGYTPPTRIEQLANDTAMNASSKRLFYVYHPEINNKETFNFNCRENEQTIILGCYVNGTGIYILDVKDERLNGIQQVTAAHEMLHAAYARLGSDEKEKVNNMTQAAFAIISNQRIKDTVEQYRSNNPVSVPSELHSILGTEVRELPLELEDYYRKYFTDRQAVVAFSEQYEQAFTDRKNQLNAYSAQLDSLKLQIDLLQKELPDERSRIESNRNSVNALAQSGDAAAYNAAASTFRAEVARYNAKVDRLNGLIAQYNEIIPKANALLSEEKELIEAIDSRDTKTSAQ